MNLVIDHGNTAAKVGIFDHQNLVESHSFASWGELIDYVGSVSATRAIVCSVQGKGQEIFDALPLDSKSKFILSHILPLPIVNEYATPHTLGVDRLAGVCGAVALFPNEDCLVIDSGTCITFDCVTKHGVYLGGAISPGLKMRFQSVHTFTARLPLISAKPDVRLIGNSTESCIQSGIVNGMCAEIDGIISRYQNGFPSIRVILCGGDTQFFENQLKASIFASPELVLIGLNRILSHNVNL